MFCNSFRQVLILHHSFDVQGFHHDSIWLGFHDISCDLMKIICSDIGQPSMQVLYFLFDVYNVAGFDETVSLLIHFIFSRNLTLQPTKAFLYLFYCLCFVGIFLFLFLSIRANFYIGTLFTSLHRF